MTKIAITIIFIEVFFTHETHCVPCNPEYFLVKIETNNKICVCTGDTSAPNKTSRPASTQRHQRGTTQGKPGALTCTYSLWHATRPMVANDIRVLKF